MARGSGEHVVLTLTKVFHVTMDGPGCSHYVDEFRRR